MKEFVVGFDLQATHVRDGRSALGGLRISEQGAGSRDRRTQMLATEAIEVARLELFRQ